MNIGSNNNKEASAIAAKQSIRATNGAQHHTANQQQRIVSLTQRDVLASENIKACTLSVPKCYIDKGNESLSALSS